MEEVIWLVIVLTRGYSDEILCDIVPMQYAHVLLGGRNTIEIKEGIKRGEINAIFPLSKIKASTSSNIPFHAIFISKPSKGITTSSLSSCNKKNDIKKAIRRGDTFNLLVIHKLTTDLDSSLVLHSESCFRNASINELLADFSDLFPKEMPKGLPPLRGIKHQIDFVPGSTLPNRPAYKTNPVEAKEIQKQVEELLEIGHIEKA
ncbi:PREDICTED: uncharacterized protein LOC109167337 [Ipomoea nil]|uniref:uncharacterized protein LOC109167337 n=1 Tax=Ipomoea nil TaxID=35883 RepID=UPI000900C3F5|nr:PREDICTED: uncharacterized protein LOC109167337 [Ipomoea nil]